MKTQLQIVSLSVQRGKVSISNQQQNVPQTASITEQDVLNRSFDALSTHSLTEHHLITTDRGQVNLHELHYTHLHWERTAPYNWRRLRSASSNRLDVPSFRLPTVGSRAFPVAGAKVWNSLPDDVTSALSLSTFRRHLKTYLFRCCYNTD